jgi:hypothetical protein
MKLGTNVKSPKLFETQRAKPPQTSPNTTTSSRPASPAATPHAAPTLTTKPRNYADPRHLASGSFIGESVSKGQVWWSWRAWVRSCSTYPNCRARMSPIYNVSGGMDRKEAQPTFKK